MIEGLIALYSPSYPKVLVYMLQNTEYQAGPYLAWYWRTTNFNKVMKRRQLEPTKAARLLLLALRIGIGLQILLGAILIYSWYSFHLVGGLAFGFALIIAYPVLWAHLAVVPLIIGREVVIRPKEVQSITQSESIFRKHSGIKLAIAGSYGKTSMKELLVMVLGQGKKVAATPANKNVAISHANFAKKLIGDEDILIIEYGEGKPGDVAKFAKTTHPTHGVITGLAPAHLDHYKTLQAAGEDIFSLADYLHGEKVYVNTDSAETKAFMKDSYHGYDLDGALGWIVSNVKLTITGTSFTMTKGKKKLTLHSALLGRHQVGPLALAAALGDEFGLTKAQIEAGVGETAPFEHRMQPYILAGAWVIDDTYNGNIEGIRAGTQLLKELKAKHKIYVTPGLVDQGVETEKVHKEMGEMIAAAKPDLVVLMQNSTTKLIQLGLESGGFKSELIIEPEPLKFYTNLDKVVASGDLVMLQNDWPDNYA